MEDINLYLKNLGKKIRQLREDSKANQSVFAEDVGISERQLRRIELGKASPKLETLIKISDYLKIDLVDMLAF